MGRLSGNGSIISGQFGGILDTLEQEPLVEESKPAEETTNWKRFVLDVIETLVLAVILFVGINSVSARVRVDGFSMQPTLQDGEFVLVSKLSYKFGDFQHGDIIVFDFPLNPDEELVKRIIGLPGDHVVVRDSHVYVNDQMLNENYIAQAPLYSPSTTSASTATAPSARTISGLTSSSSRLARLASANAAIAMTDLTSAGRSAAFLPR